MRHLMIIAVVVAFAAAVPSQSAAEHESSALPIGPHLVVTGMGITPIEAFDTGTPSTDIDVVTGTPVVFCWTAQSVTDYRWGFDIIDPNDPSQWEVDWTPFDGSETCNTAHTFFTGTHTFTVDVRDYFGVIARVPITMHIVTAPLAAEPATWGAIKALYR